MRKPAKVTTVLAVSLVAPVVTVAAQRVAPAGVVRPTLVYERFSDSPTIFSSSSNDDSAQLRVVNARRSYRRRMSSVEVQTSSASAFAEQLPTGGQDPIGGGSTRTGPTRAKCASNSRSKASRRVRQSWRSVFSSSTRQ